MKEIPKGEGLFEQIRKDSPMSKEDWEKLVKKYPQLKMFE